MRKDQSKLKSFVSKVRKVKSFIDTIPVFFRLHMSGVNLSNVKDLRKISKLLKLFPGKMSEKDLLTYLLQSQSQIDQELIAFLLVGSGGGGGYFVEFGACDGIFASNTYYLEKSQGWTGVLSEPIPHWYEDLKNNRTAKSYPFAVSAHHQGSVEFIEANEPGLSTIQGYEDTDRHRLLRVDGKRYTVETRTLSDLLHLADSPRQIDYMSMDTEGSELDILATFPFDEYTFRFISIEHNDSDNRNHIKDFMNLKGYREILPEFSGGEWWFIPRV